MNRRNVLLGLAAGFIVLVGAVWFFFIRSDAPPEVSLEDAIAAVTDDTTTTTADAGTPETTAATETSSAPQTTTADSSTPETTAATETTSASETTAGPATLDGSWDIDQSASFAGYRIGEELANIGTVTAVGRTTDVEATLTFAGTAVTELSVTVDMTTLQSDRSQRDNALRTRGLETNDFPTATFVLTEPLELGVAPVEDEPFSGTAVGDLTLHGVTNSISMPVEGSLVPGTVVVIGSVDVALADYGMEPPTGFSVLSINDTGTIEVQLAFVRP